MTGNLQRQQSNILSFKKYPHPDNGTKGRVLCVSRSWVMKVVGARYNNYTNHLPQSKTIPTLSCFIILACIDRESRVGGRIFLAGSDI